MLPTVARTLTAAQAATTAATTRALATAAGVVLIATGTTAPDALMRTGWLDTSARAQTAKPSSTLPDFADVVERVKPAVIGVRARVEDKTIGSGSPLDQILRDQNDKSAPPPGPRMNVNQGSGFFISADGYAVTTNHLIENSKAVDVVTDDNRTFSARVVGADPMTDLALLKVDSNDAFPHVQMADRPPRIGEWVIVIGNPFGLGGSITAGIVSARARDIQQANYNDFVQIDAAVNRGNSGGPAFDLDGNVIGVNSAVLSETGISVGIGFAIPADTVTAVIAALKDKGVVTRGWIGIQVVSVTEEVAKKLGIAEARGALVVEPQADGPAAKGGLAAGDIVVSVNGAPVKDSRELVRRISALAPGTTIDVGVLRKDQTVTVKVTLGDLSKSRG
jgi:serine protease Do